MRRLVLGLLGTLGLGSTAELLGAVLPLLACEIVRMIRIPGIGIEGDARCWREAFSILSAAPMRTRR